MADRLNNLAPDSRNYNALSDVLNRGLVAGTLGAPVDLMTTAMRPFGYSVENPVGGSEWMGQKMQDYGLVSPERRPLAELASGLAMPAGAAAKTIVNAAKEARFAQKVASEARTAEENLAGFKKAQENNTFIYNKNDQSQGYGRRQGYPQPAGTPSDKLASNFADEKVNFKKDGSHPQDKESISLLREKIFDRALQSPSQFPKDAISTSVIPFRDGMSIVVEAADKGNTRLQVMKDGLPVAAAGLKKGLLDTIGVHESMKGQQIGKDLLSFIHDNKLGNALEVPDRSPGFITIQKELVKRLESLK